MIYLIQTEAEEAILNKKKSARCMIKYTERQKTAKVDSALEEQFHTGRLLGYYDHIICIVQY